MASKTAPRLFSEGPIERGGEKSLSPEQTHYLAHVLRLSPKDKVLIFNGVDGEWIAELKQGKGAFKVMPIEQTRPQTVAQDLIYAFAPLKHARMDYVVQKAVEMGASVLQPVLTARTVVNKVNVERAGANAIEAAEQCGILSVPAVLPPKKLKAMLQEWDNSRLLIFCDESAEVSSPLSILHALSRGMPAAVLIGPEGGFTDEERHLIASKPFAHAISLGPRIMRADTAGVAALALCNAVLGDWR
jgi:16S rRNA (uracil1498-N3)-methyltransferase